MNYQVDQCVVFCKTREQWGGLSNMAGGYPITVGGHAFRTSEALYQAMRFPDHPEIQRAIVDQKSPMAAKMTAKAHLNLSRPDWEVGQQVRLAVMQWALALKWTQNPAFRELLQSTGGKMIVELSRRDMFWGAVTTRMEGMLVGDNMLGNMLVILREESRSHPPDITPAWSRPLLFGVSLSD